MLEFPKGRGFPHSSVSKESACNEGDLGLIPGSGRSSGEGNGNPLQYSCLENPGTEESDRLQSMGLQDIQRVDGEGSWTMFTWLCLSRLGTV